MVACCAGFLPSCWKTACSNSSRVHQVSSADPSHDAKYGLSVDADAKSKPVFHGRWICKATWGLDAFLIAYGTGYFQRSFAVNAAWPTWEFIEEDDKILFVNKGTLGETREDFCADGTLYIALNGWRQKMICRAFWEEETLVILRSSPHGLFREERLIDANGLLCFTLRGLEPPVQNHAWGRTFEREKSDIEAVGNDESDAAKHEMEVQLRGLGFDANDVRQVVAEASTVEEAANMLIERTEPPAEGSSLWEFFTGTNAVSASDCFPPGKYQMVKHRAVVSSSPDMNDVVDHLEEGDIVDIVQVEVVEESVNILGKISEQRWISIMRDGESIAEQMPLLQQLLDLGFWESQAQEAVKLHSSLEAAVGYLSGSGQAPVVQCANDRCLPGRYQILKQRVVVSSSFEMDDVVDYAKEGDVVDIAAVKIFEEGGKVLGQMHDERWIVITADGESNAKRVPLVPQLVGLGFSEEQARVAEKRYSSLEAAVGFLVDSSSVLVDSADDL